MIDRDKTRETQIDIFNNRVVRYYLLFYIIFILYFLKLDGDTGMIIILYKLFWELKKSTGSNIEGVESQ